MDVDRHTNLPEERMSQCRSFSNNYRSCSQSRKISVGVLVDSIGKAERKDIKEAVVQIAENGTSTKGKCVKEHEGQSPLVEKHVTVEEKDTFPWVSTRSINPNIPSSAAVHDTEHTPSFLGASKTHPRSKLLEKVSAAHSLKFFAGKTGSESSKGRQNNFDKAKTGKVNNAKHVENFTFSTEPGVLAGKEQEEDKDGKTESTGRENLRMKLWEILGNVSSPNKNCRSSQSIELQPDQERDGKHHPVEKRIANSDTIESDSEKLTSRRPITRSLTRKKASTKHQHKKIEATKSTSHRKECPRKRIFSFKGDYSGRLYDSFHDGSSHSKRNKIERGNSGLETHQDKYENAEQRQQSENKSRSIPSVEKSMFHRTEGFIANSSSDRRNDIFVEPKSGTKKTNSFEPPLNVMTEQQNDVELQKDMEYPNFKDQHVDIAGSLLKTKRNSRNHPSSPPFELKSPVCSPKYNRGKPHGQRPAEKEFNMKGIRCFRSLLSPKSAECKPNVQAESSDGIDELNDCLLVKPSFIMEDDSGNLISNSSIDATDSESSEDDSHMKGFRESEQLSPEVCIAEEFAHGPDANLDSEKDIEVTGCTPVSESLKGIQESSELQMHLKQNRQDGLASAVAILTIALGRVKAKLMSMSSKRSAEIVQATAEEIFSLLQNADSQIKTDVGKLTNLSQSKRNWLETRFQEQQGQLLGIYKRFKEEVDLHLQNYNSVIEDIEEYGVELKRTAERKRAAQKKIISQVEQEIQVQLDCAESRIVAVQELARKKMLQLKVVVAESIKHGPFG